MLFLPNAQVHLTFHKKYKGKFLRYVLIMSHTRFRVNPHSIVSWMSRNEIRSLSDCNWTRTHNHLVHKRTLNYLAKMWQPFDMIRTYSQIDCTDKYSQHSSKLLLFFLHYLTVLLFYSIVWKLSEEDMGILVTFYKSRFFSKVAI